MAQAKPQTIEGDYRIMPRDIDTSRHFFDAFGSFESENTARWIVVHMQQIGTWAPFHIEEVERLCEDTQEAPASDRFSTNPLVDLDRPERLKWITLGGDGFYRVTDEFIHRCHAAAPMERKSGMYRAVK